MSEGVTKEQLLESIDNLTTALKETLNPQEAEKEPTEKFAEFVGSCAGILTTYCATVFTKKFLILMLQHMGIGFSRRRDVFVANVAINGIATWVAMNTGDRVKTNVEDSINNVVETIKKLKESFKQIREMTEKSEEQQRLNKDVEKRASERIEQIKAEKAKAESGKKSDKKETVEKPNSKDSSSNSGVSEVIDISDRFQNSEKGVDEISDEEYMAIIEQEYKAQGIPWNRQARRNAAKFLQAYKKTLKNDNSKE